MGLIGYSILKDGLPMKALDRRAVLESVPIRLFVVFIPKWTKITYELYATRCFLGFDLVNNLKPMRVLIKKLLSASSMRGHWLWKNKWWQWLTLRQPPTPWPILHLDAILGDFFSFSLFGEVARRIRKLISGFGKRNDLASHLKTSKDSERLV